MTESADPKFIYQLMLGLSMLGNFALMAMKFLGKPEKREITPNPVPIIHAERYVTEEKHRALELRVDGHDEEISGLHDKIEEKTSDILRKEAEARSRLHEKINTVASDVSSIKASLKPLEHLPSEFSRAIGRIEGAIQRNQ